MRTMTILAITLIVSACGGSIGTAQASQSTNAAIEQRDYDVSGFTRVSTTGPHRVIVSVGPAFSVHAEGPAATLQRTDVLVENGELKIRPIEGDHWKREWRGYLPATYRVTLPSIAAASMAGSGAMTVDQVSGDGFAASLAGSGSLDVMDLKVREAHLSLAGSGDMIAEGSASKTDISLAGSGQIRARKLTSGSASVSLAGSGDAALTVIGTAEVSLVGSGDIDIAGSAACTVSRRGSGKVACGRETETARR